MDYFGAGLISASLGTLQLLLQLESRPTWKAAHWWLLYIALEVASGALAYKGLAEVISSPWVDGIWGWLIAGTGAAAILRLRVTELRSAHDISVPVGPAFLYELFRGFFEDQIDNIGAAEQADWISSRLIPKLRQTSPATIAPLIEAYVRSSGKLDAVRKEQTIHFLSETLAEVSSDDRQKRESLIWHALEVGGWRLLRRLYRQTGRRSPAGRDG